MIYINYYGTLKYPRFNKVKLLSSFSLEITLVSLAFIMLSLTTCVANQGMEGLLSVPMVLTKVCVLSSSLFTLDGCLSHTALCTLSSLIDDFL